MKEGRLSRVMLGIATGFLVAAPLVPDPFALGVLGGLTVVAMILIISRMEKKKYNSPPPLS